METQDRITVVDQSLKTINACSFQDKLTHLVESAESKLGLNEIAKYKADYFDRFGKVFPDDSNYHERINYFLDQLIFETPKLENAIYSGINDDQGIHGFLHSIFQIRVLKENSMIVDDLISGHDFKVDITHYKDFLFTAEKKDIFQGFLYFNKNNDVLILSQGILFHPKKCHTILKKHIKNSKKKEGYVKVELLSRLAKSQIKFKRMKHLKPQMVYRELEKHNL